VPKSAKKPAAKPEKDQLNHESDEEEESVVRFISIVRVRDIMLRLVLMTLDESERLCIPM
jgi:hypothetical protein